MSSQTMLVRYDAARKALAEASRVDDAKEIRDHAEALRVYARQRDDVEMERWLAEIKLRATVRIGELSRALADGRGPGRGKKVATDGNVFKRDALRAAGITTSQAHRAEQLAAPDARTKVEAYIAEQAAARKPVTITQALRVVKPSATDKLSHALGSDVRRRLRMTTQPTKTLHRQWQLEARHILSLIAATRQAADDGRISESDASSIKEMAGVIARALC